MSSQSSQNSDNNKKLVLFLGYGYVARHLVTELHRHNYAHIILPTRDKNAAKKALFKRIFDRMGLLRKKKEASNNPLSLEAIVTSLKQNEIAIDDPTLTNTTATQFDYLNFVQNKLQDVTHILVTAPPDGKKDPAFDKYHNILLEKKCPKLEWLGYLSATSVYGDLDGKECDENTILNPISERGKNRAYAETIWMSLFKTHQVPTHIFRLTGIYGPERNNITDIKHARITSVIKEGYLNNRIYIKDIVRGLICSMNNPTPGEIYNLTDDMPASTAAVNDYIAFMIGADQPKKILYQDAEKQMSDMKKSFFAENKVVTNNKIKNKLGFTLKYPTYRDGITDIIKTAIGANDNKQ